LNGAALHSILGDLRPFLPFLFAATEETERVWLQNKSVACDDGADGYSDDALSILKGMRDKVYTMAYYREKDHQSNVRSLSVHFRLERQREQQRKKRFWTRASRRIRGMLSFLFRL
jgi:hypothetical protein